VQQDGHTDQCRTGEENRVHTISLTSGETIGTTFRQEADFALVTPA